MWKEYITFAQESCRDVRCEHRIDEKGFQLPVWWTTWKMLLFGKTRLLQVYSNDFIEIRSISSKMFKFSGQTVQSVTQTILYKQDIHIKQNYSRRQQRPPFQVLWTVTRTYIHTHPYKATRPFHTFNISMLNAKVILYKVLKIYKHLNYIVASTNPMQHFSERECSFKKKTFLCDRLLGNIST